MEGEDRGLASREVTQGRFETSSTISQASVVNLSQGLVTNL